ncbi:hypothetical protein Cgig2_027781 [Carnegiea gigantea]|uniref:Uncharacterized protein n=1 Tax=Carnegiea gigantea TaxID=171969 RepID=A0A9Q1JGM2_9CARY|nr:hypothetical protein Cgig2_027781 [Carnegiea gigantea]
MPIGLSIHTPMLLKFLDYPRQRSEFRFHDMWIIDPLFKVRLLKITMREVKMSRLYVVPNTLKKPLQRLNKDKLPEIHTQQMWSSKLGKRDEKFIHGHSLIIFIFNEVIIQDRLYSLCDQCTRFFFAKMKQRRMANCIYSFHDSNGDQVKGFDNVATIMSSVYHNLLGKLKYTIVSIEDKSDFSIPGMKSLGLAGYNSGFYKAIWKEVSDLVYKVVQEFFYKEKLRKCWNNINLIILLKIQVSKKGGSILSIWGSLVYLESCQSWTAECWRINHSKNQDFVSKTHIVRKDNKPC